MEHNKQAYTSVADPAMGGPGAPSPRPLIDQNLGLVMAARLKHGGGANFHLNP